MYNKVFDQNVILQAENGSILFYDNQIVLGSTAFRKLAKIRNAIKTLPISGFEPKQCILTVHSKTQLFEIYEIVNSYDLGDELKVMWNGEAFDIQPKNVSKGNSLLALMKLLSLEKDNVLSIGDRINDREMIEVSGIGVSADIQNLRAEFWTKGQELPADILVDYLIKIYEL